MNAVLDSLYKQVVGLVNSGMIVLNMDRAVVLWNDWMHQHSSIKSEQIQGQVIFDVLPELVDTRIDRSIKKALEFNCPSVLSAKLLDANFPLFKVLITGKREPERLIQSILIKPFKRENERFCLISIFDISSSDLREKALREQSAMLSSAVAELERKDYELHALFHNTQNAIIVFDQAGAIINANPSAHQLLKLDDNKTGQAKIFHYFQSLDPLFFGKPDTEAYVGTVLSLNGKESEMKLTDDDGTQIDVSVSANLIQYEKQQSRFFIFFRDITEKKRAETALKRMARVDPLTGLANRISFIDKLEQTITFNQRHRCKLSIFFIDLDRFKRINDVYGHDAGDTVLLEISRRLANNCRQSDVVGRWAGDEFVAMYEYNQLGRDDVAVAEKILKEVQEPVSLGEQQVHVGCSVGIARFPEDGTASSELIANADKAMFQAKQQGKGTFRFFDAQLNNVAKQRLQIESELRQAITQKQFDVYYQPIVRLSNGAFSGVEALLRWNHPTRGVVCPEEFVSVAEDCGLIGSIGEWVVTQSIEETNPWTHHKTWPLGLNINLSARQFCDQHLAEKIRALLVKSQVNVERVTLEVTENTLVEEGIRGVDTLEQLKKIGVNIAIDDFGTGYSSLAYLRDLPVDIIKLDKAFIADIDHDKVSRKIVAAVTDLSHALGMQVIAEGIERQEQLAIAKEIGCDFGQGYFFSYPLRDADIDALHQEALSHAEDVPVLHGANK